nr:unnamed protein product [Callosobruchus chinensis]
MQSREEQFDSSMTRP